MALGVVLLSARYELGARDTTAAAATITSHYAFTANYNDNSVSTYAVDVSTGRLKCIGKVEAGESPTSVAVDPSGKFAYVANCDGNTISQYAIGKKGALIPIANAATVESGLCPLFITIHPTGKFAYVANKSYYFQDRYISSVSQYTINRNGTLTANASAPEVEAGINPSSVAIVPSGKYAYVANSGDSRNAGSVSQYTIGENGALTANTIAATVAVGDKPVSIAVDPSGKFVYAANEGGTISQYTIGRNGALTPNTIRAKVRAGRKPCAISVDPSGRFVYVVNEEDYHFAGTVSQYTIGSNGALSPNAAAYEPTVAAGINSKFVTVDPSGKFAYVVNAGGDDNDAGTGTVSQYTIGENGVLTPLSPAAVAGDARPVSIVVTAGSAAKRAAPQSADVANTGNSGNAVIVSSGKNGALAPNAIAATVAAEKSPASVTVNPAGKPANHDEGSHTRTAAQYAIGDSPRYTFTVNYDDKSVSTFVVDASSGRLKYLGKIATKKAPVFVSVDPSGRFAYMANGGDNTISQYSIGANGVLTPIATAAKVAADLFPVSVTIDPSGRFAYVSNSGESPHITASTISQYTIAANGALMPNAAAAMVATGHDPSPVAVDPSGRFAYVANRGDGTDDPMGRNKELTGTVSQYTIGENGELTPNTAAPTVAAGESPSSVTVDPSGKFAYVTNRGEGKEAGTISQYIIGKNGTLTPNPAAATVAAGVRPISIAVDPSGKFAYVANEGYGDQASTVSQYTIGANGTLTPNAIAETVVTREEPQSVTVDPTGRFVYVVCASDGAVSQYIIGKNGALTPDAALKK